MDIIMVKFTTLNGVCVIKPSKSQIEIFETIETIYFVLSVKCQSYLIHDST